MTWSWYQRRARADRSGSGRRRAGPVRTGSRPQPSSGRSQSAVQVHDAFGRSVLPRPRRARRRSVQGGTSRAHRRRRRSRARACPSPAAAQRAGSSASTVTASPRWTSTVGPGNVPVKPHMRDSRQVAMESVRSNSDQHGEPAAVLARDESGCGTGSSSTNGISGGFGIMDAGRSCQCALCSAGPKGRWFKSSRQRKRGNDGLRDITNGMAIGRPGLLARHSGVRVLVGRVCDQRCGPAVAAQRRDRRSVGPREPGLPHGCVQAQRKHRSHAVEGSHLLRPPHGGESGAGTQQLAAGLSLEGPGRDFPAPSHHSGTSRPRRDALDRRQILVAAPRDRPRRLGLLAGRGASRCVLLRRL